MSEREPGPARRMISVDAILASQATEDGRASVYHAVRERLYPGDISRVASFIAELSDRSAEITEPGVLINALMATYGCRASLGAGRDVLVIAASSRLAQLIGSERAAVLVGALSPAIAESAG